jgi:hypothetical protein
MAERAELLRRLCVALQRPGVGGVLATADILEDLLLLGALEEKVVFGSMNRGGLLGATWEVDDRFTAYHARKLAELGFQGGKMLLRIDLQDPATATVLTAAAHAIDELSARGLVAMIEPLMVTRTDGHLQPVLSTEAAIMASAVAAGLGSTSAYTWLKIPVAEDAARAIAATTLPTLLLGGDLREDQAAFFASCRELLALPNVVGMVVGRCLLYPADDDVAGTADALVSLMRGKDRTL